MLLYMLSNISNQVKYNGTVSKYMPLKHINQCVIIDVQKWKHLLPKMGDQKIANLLPLRNTRGGKHLNVVAIYLANSV